MSRQLKDIDDRLKEMGFEQLSYPNRNASVELLDSLLDQIYIYREKYGTIDSEELMSYLVEVNL